MNSLFFMTEYQILIANFAEALLTKTHFFESLPTYK